MGKNNGYRVGLKERKVVLLATQDGTEYKLTHVLKQPTTSNWIDYNRQVSNVDYKGRKTKIETNVLGARIWLYDELIVRADGYFDDETGKPVTPELPAWSDKIPALHKSEVINTFGEFSAGEEMGKN